MDRAQLPRTLAAATRVNILAFVVATFLTGSLLIMPTSPARAVHACYASPSASNCDGVDPQVAGCNADAYTVTSADIRNLQNQVVGRTDLRWSPKCKTNWARAVSYGGSGNMFAVLLSCSSNPIQNTYFQLANTTSVYGDMKYNTTVRARGAFGWDGVSDVYGDTGCY